MDIYSLHYEQDAQTLSLLSLGINAMGMAHDNAPTLASTSQAPAPGLQPPWAASGALTQLSEGYP